MKCKMCGAELKKEGDICTNCYKKYTRDQALKQDNEKELFSIKRKYSPKFNLMKNGEIIALEVIIALAAVSTYSAFPAILIVLLCIVSFGAWMYYNKRRAMGTKITFYETKFKYKAKYFFVNKEEIIPYSDIKDMAYFQSRSQKICKIGDIRFYTKGFLSGLTVHDIPNIEENFGKMRDIINSTR